MCGLREMPRGRAPRPEDFGRYDPTTHTLIIDREPGVPPGHPHSPIALRVGERGRLHAVLDSHDDDILQRAARAGVPMSEPVTEMHEHHKRVVARPERFGRYDPISSSLAFRKGDGSEHTVKVGDNGRLRAVLESGMVDSREARAIGLPAPETYKGKAKPGGDPGWFNPLTHEYNIDSSPRDFARSSGRRPPSLGNSLTPRLNPLTQKLDPLNSTPASLRVYDPRVLHPQDLHIVPRPPIIAHGFHSAELACRPLESLGTGSSTISSPRWF